MNKFWSLFLLALVLSPAALAGCGGQVSQESARDQVEREDAQEQPEEEEADR
jgi:hypothetical protein